MVADVELAQRAQAAEAADNGSDRTACRVAELFRRIRARQQTSGREYVRLTPPHRETGADRNPERTRPTPLTLI